MIVNTLTLDADDFPEVLKHIGTPPTILFTAGSSLKDLLSRPCVTIVGSRKEVPTERPLQDSSLVSSPGQGSLL